MTNEAGFQDVLDPALVAALEEKGFTALTQVQRAVLDPAAAGRDLRISSQTGSGKTVAIGFVLHELVAAERTDPKAGPAALVIAPTRELARQVETELSWLYAKLGARVATITGGASYRDEHRALAARPHVVVGTPGRILDHLERGTLDLGSVGAVVLDEADRMLDLGFREALEAILARMPSERRTHLVSATFADDVRRLADRVQKRAMHVEGTRLGAANVDIEHVVHMVEPRQRFDAVVNLLLAHHDARTLVFARTRADVADIAESLTEAGFGVAPLSGEMEQRERSRALSAFKRGSVRVLVATDVAARGLDVQDVTLVLHVEPPTDADSYTHRSGRTGRAGRKGTSALLVAPRELPGVRRVLSRASVRFRTEPVPDAASIRRAIDDRLIADLTATESETPDERTLELARRLVESGEAERTIARLLAKSPDAQGPTPREVRVLVPETRPERPRVAPAASARDFGNARRPREMGPRDMGPRDMGAREMGPREMGPREMGPRDMGAREMGAREVGPRDMGPRDMGAREVGPRDMGARDTGPRSFVPRDGGARDAGPQPFVPRDIGPRAPREVTPGASRPPRDLDRRWTLFHVTWGARHGADPRRVLAMLCRRGGIESTDIGGIRVGPLSSEVQISEEVAASFAEAAGRPDPRDPRVSISADQPLASPARAPRASTTRPTASRPAARAIGGATAPRRAAR